MTDHYEAPAGPVSWDADDGAALGPPASLPYMNAPDTVTHKTAITEITGSASMITS